MKLYFQHPPTGEFPCLGLDFYEEQRADLYWVDWYPYSYTDVINNTLRDFKGWKPCKDPEFRAQLIPPHGFLGLPCFNIEGHNFNEVVVAVEEMLQEHPTPEEGAFGIWSRGVYKLLHDHFETDLGIVWHPDPTAFSRCQAQADLESRIGEVNANKLVGSFHWKPIPDVRTLLESALVVHPGLKHA